MKSVCSIPLSSIELLRSNEEPETRFRCWATFGELLVTDVGLVKEFETWDSEEAPLEAGTGVVLAACVEVLVLAGVDVAIEADVDDGELLVVGVCVLIVWGADVAIGVDVGDGELLVVGVVVLYVKLVA